MQHVMKQETVSQKVRFLAFMGLMLAMAVALSFLEGLIPAIPALPPGVKLGLSNIVTMYALFFLGPLPAAVIVVLKSGFVLLTRGVVAFLLSLSGGILSVLVMIAVLAVTRRKASYLLVSVFGAVFHNIGQLITASLLTQPSLFLAYLPVLLLSGVGMGIITGAILKIVLPALGRLKNSIYRPQ